MSRLVKDCGDCVVECDEDEANAIVFQHGEMVCGSHGRALEFMIGENRKLLVTPCWECLDDSWYSGSDDGYEAGLEECGK